MMNKAATVSVERVGDGWVVTVADGRTPAFHCATEAMARQLSRVLERAAGRPATSRR